MQKIFNHKSLNYFVWTPICALKVHFKVSAAYYCSNYLLPVSLTPVANFHPEIVPIVCHRSCWHRWLICHRCRWYRFATNINNTSEIGGKICCRWRWYRWQICHRCCLFENSRRYSQLKVHHWCRWQRWSSGNDIKTKEERSFNLDFVLDIEAKRTCLFQNL